MAFMDKFKDIAGQGLNIAKDLGEKGLDKAKDLKDIGAAKAKILMDQSKIKDVYTEIGKMVVEAGGMIPEAGIAAQLQRIQELEGDIAAQNTIIRNLENNGDEAKIDFEEVVENTEAPAEEKAE